MKVKLIVSTAASILLSSTLAYAMPPKPAKCPDASALKSIAPEAMEQDQDGTWAAAVMANKYGTNDTWTFVIGKIKASSEKDARTKAIEGMKSLTFRQGPVPIEQYNVWACAFSSKENYPAVTVTPALGFRSAAQLIK